jgi:hypothetical protein
MPHYQFKDPVLPARDVIKFVWSAQDWLVNEVLPQTEALTG